MKDFVNTLLTNLKIEIVAAVFLCALFICIEYLPINFPFDDKLLKYFNQDRLNGIATFFAITIGVYIAVITVLATSEIGISKEMLKKNLDKPLIDVIIAGMAENFTTVGLAIFIPLNKFTGKILIIILTISIISFVKFIILLIAIFKANMNQMAKEIDAEERYKDSILGYLRTISRNSQSHIDE